mmetsp:Transcript_21592/g.50821  ORF Transcript_21592/g.50821 Transcript_21592/m.50821 type:complete len:744 (+) Transcript_21592:91-2322(+)
MRNAPESGVLAVEALTPFCTQLEPESGLDRHFLLRKPCGGLVSVRSPDASITWLHEFVRTALGVSDFWLSVSGRPVGPGCPDIGLEVICHQRLKGGAICSQCGDQSKDTKALNSICSICAQQPTLRRRSSMVLSKDKKLRIAAEAGDEAAVMTLLEARAHQDARARSTGETALHLAAKRGHLGTVRILLQASFSTTARDNSGRTPIDVAQKAGYLRLSTELSSCPAVSSSLPVSPNASCNSQPPTPQRGRLAEIMGWGNKVSQPKARDETAKLDDSAAIAVAKSVHDSVVCGDHARLDAALQVLECLDMLQFDQPQTVLAPLITTLLLPTTGPAASHAPASHFATKQRIARIAHVIVQQVFIRCARECRVLTTESREAILGQDLRKCAKGLGDAKWPVSGVRLELECMLACIRSLSFETDIRVQEDLISLITLGGLMAPPWPPCGDKHSAVWDAIVAKDSWVARVWGQHWYMQVLLLHALKVLVVADRVPIERLLPSSEATGDHNWCATSARVDCIGSVAMHHKSPVVVSKAVFGSNDQNGLVQLSAYHAPHADSWRVRERAVACLWQLLDHHDVQVQETARQTLKERKESESDPRVLMVISPLCEVIVSDITYDDLDLGDGHVAITDHQADFTDIDCGDVDYPEGDVLGEKNSENSMGASRMVIPTVPAFPKDQAEGQHISTIGRSNASVLDCMCHSCPLCVQNMAARAHGASSLPLQASLLLGRNLCPTKPDKGGARSLFI